MRKIVYYVATSLDGYISGPDKDISLFVQEGDLVDQYLRDLQDFDTVIMGRNTYEFGYDYGLKPGQPAYAHMEHYIFSDTLLLPDIHEKVHVVPVDLDKVKALKNTMGTEIYLCGGGQFAGWLLDHGLIDVLKIKLNPILLGGGVPLFGASMTNTRLKLVAEASYEQGAMILTYEFEKTR
jgi:dihydrofolate reductase